MLFTDKQKGLVGMNDRTDKVMNVIIYVLLSFIFLFMCIFIYGMIDFYNDYRCSTMPLNEFLQDKTCRKYWGLRDE